MSDPSTPSTPKRSLTLSDDDVVVKRSDRSRAIERIGGTLGPNAKVATDVAGAGPRPPGGGAPTDADA